MAIKKAEPSEVQPFKYIYLKYFLHIVRELGARLRGELGLSDDDRLLLGQETLLLDRRHGQRLAEVHRLKVDTVAYVLVLNHFAHVFIDVFSAAYGNRGIKVCSIFNKVCNLEKKMR